MNETYALEGWGTDDDDEYPSHEEAVDRYASLLADARSEGWHVEEGWASRDNLLAARLTRGGGIEKFLAIVRIEHHDDW